MPLKGKERFKRRLRGKGDKLVRAVGLEGARRLIRRTPVDKGRARGGWDIGIGEPVRAETGVLDRGGATTQQKAAAKILADFKAGQRLFITNAVPYVKELDAGSSKQAPEGMVAVTVAEMKPVVAQVAAKLATEGDDAL